MRTFLSALVAAALCACSSGPDRAGQPTQGFYAPDFEVLWDVARREMKRAGYVPDDERSDRRTRTIVSRPNVDLAPFSMKGTREQATLTLREIPDRPGYWSAEANVLRELNANIKDPTNIGRAEWTKGERVPEKERRLVWGIESFFLGYDVSDRFRAAYGMPPGRERIPPPPPPGTEEPTKAK